MQIDPHIFRAYDIRGVVGEGLTPASVELIGRALASAVRDAGEDTLIVGRDGRLSGPELTAALVKGARSAGVNVIDLGAVTTPMVYWAAANTPGVSSCAAITGSHNPPNYNGIKMMVAGETLSGEQIQALRQRIEQGAFHEGAGNYVRQDIAQTYIDDIAAKIDLARPLKVVVDAGNGIAGAYAPRALRAIGCEVDELFCEVDGTFPNHHPDPAKPKNLQDLIARVKETGADLGLAFDGDGDRCGVVDEQGNLLYADRQMMLYACDVLSRQPGATIIYDVKCTSLLGKEIERCGGKPLMWRTGHSFIKKKMKETGAALAGEMSGHIFFNERWYGFDDGIYTAARMCEIVAKYDGPASELFARLPNAYNTPELEIRFNEGGEHFAFMDTLKAMADFPDGKVFDLDGIRVDFADGWGLVRPSNTTPVLVLRFEGETPEALERIKTRFRDWIHRVDPDLGLPF
ncbi:phosphomannomutase [Sulfurivirga caldicuralii]|uniref:phosphomannomutase n=1 Tax=Sulfurivirga caldicuralii TaxID=364032 RepID=A0A1N6DNE8_9GAMM|nr:phosphomannomutase/phosphoglucomutase [Sulfurivirga caldicuralii]SIN72266.1 phosphomannomutase [Sulfurivirga caldicuralii]